MSEESVPGRTSASGKRVAIIVIGAVILLAVAYFAFCRKPTPQDDLSVRVVFKSNANYLVYYVAKEKGFLRDAGLKVQETELESTNLMIQALSANQADFNPSTSVP